MKLKYRTGYFLSVMMVIVAVVLSIGHIDLSKYVLLAGAIGVVFFAIYYFISDYNKEYDWRQWGNLGACVLIVSSLFFHSILPIKVDYLILVGIMLIKPFERKTESKLNIESND